MKKYLLIISAIFLATISYAQKELIIKSSSKGFYIEHKVVAKENFYSIGRLYHLHPKHIASFNSLDLNKGLTIGKLLRIPLTDSNFVQDRVGSIPVRYVVGDKETLLRVSNSHNHVPMENLRKWNRLSTDNISKGQKLVIGYLALTETGYDKAVEPPIVMKEPVKEKQEKKSPEKVETKKPEIIETKKEEPKQPTDEPKKKEQPKQEQRADNSQGYFKASFLQQVKQSPASKGQTVTSGIFKTTSGWNDAKYYLLIDGIETGTIVKIINPANNKVIYAKVLGEMNGLANNEGLDIRISNAAASVLDVDDTAKFILKLNY